MPILIGGIALFALGTELRVIGLVQLLLFIGLGVVGIGLNVFGNLLGARTFGASRLGLLGALLGLVLGLVLLGPVGLIMGPLIGAVGFELVRGREMSSALRSGVGVLVGYLLGSLAEVMIALIMAGWFFWSTFGAVTGGSLKPLV